MQRNGLFMAMINVELEGKDPVEVLLFCGSLLQFIFSPDPLLENAPLAGAA